jgi:hypothetical protein
MTGRDAWDKLGEHGFGDVVENIRSAMGAEREQDLRAKRLAGLRAYERAAEARGFKRGQIRASAQEMLGLLDDDGED